MTSATEFSYIGEYIKNYRVRRGFSLDDLAGKAQVSKSMISQIEANKVVPTIQTLSKLSSAMEIPLGALVDPHEKPKLYHQVNREDCRKISSKDKAFTCTYLSDESPNKHVDVSIFEFAKKGKHVSKGHGPHAIEYIVMQEGEMQLELGGEVLTIVKGDILEFKASGKHTYIQASRNYARGTNFVYYGV